MASAINEGQLTTEETYFPPGFKIETASLEALTTMGNVINSAWETMAKAIVEHSKELTKKGQYVGAKHTQMMKTLVELGEIRVKIANKIKSRGGNPDFSGN
jgi:hypothetical protein